MTRLLRAAPLAAGALAAVLAAAVAASTLAPRGAAAQVAAPTASAALVSAAAFDAEAARRHLVYLADPARGGRLTGSAGYAEAAAYVAERFREIGLEPAGDAGTYFQHFALKVPALTADASLAITSPEPEPFAPRTDFSELVGGPRGAGAVEAGLAYVGGAVDTPAYSDFANVDVRGKVVLVGASSEGGDPAGNAIRHGARAVLFVSAGDRGPLIHYSYLSDLAANAVPTLLLTEPAADRLVAPAGKRVADLRAQADAQRPRADRRPLSFDTGLIVRVSVPLVLRDVDAYNVVGLLRPASGTPDRAVVVGGHLDGVGTDPDGTVYPAANDNASGPAVTIEVARALAARRDRLHQDVLFVAWAAEEEGLKGSSEFLRRAAGTPFAPERLTAYLNLDVVGCCERLAASPENASLYAALSAAARREGIGLAQARGSSDHETFLRAGVAASIVIWSQIGPIHTPRDAADAVDAAHLSAVGRVVTDTALDLAGAP